MNAAALRVSPSPPGLTDRDIPTSLHAAYNQDAYFKHPGVCLGTNVSLAE